MIGIPLPPPRPRPAAHAALQLAWEKRTVLGPKLAAFRRQMGGRHPGLLRAKLVRTAMQEQAAAEVDQPLTEQQVGLGCVGVDRCVGEELGWACALLRCSQVM